MIGRLLLLSLLASPLTSLGQLFPELVSQHFYDNLGEDSPTSIIRDSRGLSTWGAIRLFLMKWTKIAPIFG